MDGFDNELTEQLEITGQIDELIITLEEKETEENEDNGDDNNGED